MISQTKKMNYWNTEKKIMTRWKQLKLSEIFVYINLMRSLYLLMNEFDI